MSRLPAPRREALAPEGQAVWDRIAASRQVTAGPFSVLLHAPALADGVASFVDYFQDQAALPSADCELVILAVVREFGARYAWERHELRGRRVGTRPEAIEVLRANGALDGLTPRERLLVEIARTLVATRALPDELFARGLAELGEQQMVELVTLVGHYCAVALVLNGFAVPPAGDCPTWSADLGSSPGIVGWGFVPRRPAVAYDSQAAGDQPLLYVCVGLIRLLFVLPTAVFGVAEPRLATAQDWGAGGANGSSRIRRWGRPPRLIA